MRSEGNGTIGTCMANLLRLRRGDVRLDILRGIDPDIIDRPEPEAVIKLQAESYWVLFNYEPRFAASGFSVSAAYSEIAKMREGNFNLDVNV